MIVISEFCYSPLQMAFEDYRYSTSCKKERQIHMPRHCSRSVWVSFLVSFLILWIFFYNSTFDDVETITNSDSIEKWTITTKHQERIAKENSSAAKLNHDTHTFSTFGRGETATTPIENAQVSHDSGTPEPAMDSSAAMLEKFYVYTSACHMPRVDPFTKAAMEVFQKEEPPKCANYSELVTKTYDHGLGRYKLKIKHTNESITCCYSEVVRNESGGEADKSVQLTDCKDISDDFIVPQHIEAIIVNCKTNGTGSFAGQEAFSFAQKRIRVSDGNSTTQNKTVHQSRRSPSVILLGVDSLSRFHFRRSMPETFEYVAGHETWIELQGYNKVGDNTLPNLMPFLAGINESLALSKCHVDQPGGVDDCDFIWKKFKANGYITAYAEDTAIISTFNWQKPGFRIPPTDYYFRPLGLAMERHMKVEEVLTLPYCIGRRQYAEYIYDYAIDILERHRNESIFSLFWTNSFSHNSFKTAATFDKKMRYYLEEFERRGFLDESIVLFFSDHGCRWGPLLSLPSGFLEERLPMFFISLPKWFKAEHPHFERTLKANAHRLATPYDIHVTLQDILKMNGLEEEKLKPPESCPTCQSIFREIPENRTCEDAAIPEHWCSCEPYSQISTDDERIQNAAQLIVDTINDYLVHKMNFSTKCETLTLNDVKSALVKQEATESKTFRVEFETKPSDAKFQATAIYHPQNTTISVDLPDISRLNTYREDSKCIEHKLSKKFCICRDSAK